MIKGPRTLNAQGASPFTIERVLGHSQLSTTKRYTHVPIEVTKAALEGVESLVESKRNKADEQNKQDMEPPAGIEPATC